MNIVNTIREETRPFQNRTAIVEGDRTITYAQLVESARTLGAAFAGLGMEPGHRIAFRCRDGIDYVVGALSLLSTGAALVPVPDSLTVSEVDDLVDRMDVHGLLTHCAIANTHEACAERSMDELFDWQPRRAAGTMDQPCRDIDAAFIRFSSGTTGVSKGVVLSHRTIIDRTDAADRGLNMSHHDVVLWTLEMSHHFVVSILLFLRKAATIVVVTERFPFSFLEAAVEVPATFIYASPVHYYLLASTDAVPASALADVRLAISTAMKLPMDTAEAFAAKFSFAPAEAYGIIEVGLPFIHCDASAGGAGTVGRILPDYELRIHRPDTSQVGEVQIRGKGMFDAYFSPWRLRDDSLSDGWFSTGDLGQIDDKGRLRLISRCKTVIVCAGMKVFPEEVEDVINAAPGVAESLVYGQEHPQFGQVPAARVVLSNATGDRDRRVMEIRRRCCDKLSSYKVPVEIDVVDSLPRTASGKLVRHCLSTA